MVKKSHTNQFRQKILMFLIVFTMAISMVSAWDFTANNVKEYDEATKTITISDNYLITKVAIAEVKLDTPIVNYVFAGKDRKVFQFTVKSYGDYLNAISKMEFYNKANMKPINREITYKYLTLEDYEVDINDYREVCIEGKEINKTTGKLDNICSQEKIGTHKETRTREIWTEMNTKDIPTGEITIGGFADVERGDNVEWIPTMFGVDVEEWATWTDSFNVGLKLYYDMNSSANIVDGTYNISTTGGTVSYNTTEAKIGKAMQFPATTSEATITQPPVFNLSKNSTSFNFWFRATTTGDNILIRETGGTQINLLNSGGVKFYQNGVVWGTAGQFGPVISTGVWYMVTYTVNNTASYWYINGTLIKASAPDGVTPTPMTFLFGRAANPSITGQYDEFGAWNRTLTPTEITDLYNGGVGITYIPTVSPTLTIIQSTPDNYYNSSSSNLLLGCNFTSINQNITSVKVFVYNTSLYYTNTISSLNTPSYNATWSLTSIPNNNYTWACYGFASEANGTTINRTFSINHFPSIAYGTGTEDNYANVSHNWIYINTTWTEANFKNITFDIGTTKQTFTIATYFYNFTGLGDGTYTYNVTICDTLNNCNRTDTRVINIDNVAPILNITYPLNSTKLQSLAQSLVVNINYTIIHNITSANCWYLNNSGVNTTITCGDNITINYTSAGWKTINLYSNDSVGNKAEVSTTFLINFFNYTVNYDSALTEGQLTTINLNMSYIDLTSLNGSVNYGSINIPMGYNSGKLNATFNTITVSADTNLTFNISYNFNGIDYITGNYYTLIYDTPNITLSTSCGDGLNASYCFNFADESNLTAISMNNVAYNFRYGSSGVLKELYGNVTGTVNAACLCINSTLNNLFNYTIDYGEIQYTKSGFADRRYYLFNGTVFNTQKNTTLYSIINGQATSFLFTVQDPQLNSIRGAYLTLNRWYPAQNSFYTVEMSKTDDKGQTIMRAKVEDPDYQVGVYYANGTLIYLAKSQRFACLASPCSYSIAVPSSSNLALNEYLDLQYNLSWSNATRTFSLVFNDPSGKTSNIKLDVFKDTGASSYLICTTNVSAATGGLSCDVTGWNGLLRAVAYRTASPETPIAVEIIQTILNNFSGSAGLAISLVIATMLVLIGIASPVLMVIMTILSLIPMIMFGVLEWKIFMIVVVMGFLVVHMMRRNNGIA